VAERDHSPAERYESELMPAKARRWSAFVNPIGTKREDLDAKKRRRSLGCVV